MRQEMSVEFFPHSLDLECSLSRCSESARTLHTLDGRRERLLTALPGLEEVLRPVCGLQSEHVALLGVVRCLGSERVVDAHGVVDAVVDARLPGHVFAFVQVEHHVPQHSVEHLPTALPNWRCEEWGQRVNHAHMWRLDRV